MASLTAEAPDQGSVPRADGSRAPSAHGLSRASGIWPGWWRRDSHKTAGVSRDAQQGTNDGAARRSGRRNDLTTSDGRRQPFLAPSTSEPATQPVLVRSYSGAKARQSSRAASKARMSDGSRTASGTPTTAVDVDARLPPIDDFKFTNLVLSAPSSDIAHAIDAIAEICARSRLSLADEYGAHLPPFSHTLPPMPRTRGQMQGQREVMRLGLGKLERTLTTVPETSSNSECSSPSTSSRKSGHSAYGELTKVLRRSGSGSVARAAGEEAGAKNAAAAKQVAMLWQGKGHGTQTVIVRVASPKVSTETATTESKAGGSASPSVSHAMSRFTQHTRSGSWFGRGSLDASKSAEARLKDLLKTPAPG